MSGKRVAPTLTINFGSTDFTRRAPRDYSQRELKAFKHYIKLIRRGDVIFLPRFFIGDGVDDEIPTLAFKGENGLVVYDFREKTSADYYNTLKNVFDSQVTYVHVSSGFPEITDYKCPTNTVFEKIYFGGGDYAALIYAVLSVRMMSYFISYDRASFVVTHYDDGCRVVITGLDKERNINIATVSVDMSGTVSVTIGDKSHHVGIMSLHQI